MKIKYALAPKCQVHNLFCGWYFNPCTVLLNHITICMQAALKTKESQVADLQENLKTQQAETSKPKEELATALSAMEQLKEGFKKERADWATEKSALIKRAEDAEAALKPVTDELTSIKRHVHAMTTAIFGKQACLLNWFCLLTESLVY